MTKEELIKRLIEMRKTGADETLDRVCESSTGCEYCPLYPTGRLCSHQTIDYLLDYIIDNELERQGTNLEHYWDKLCVHFNPHQVDGYLAYVESNMKVKEWLLQPYEESKAKYKLTQFEYDLIKAHKNAYGDNTQMTWIYVDELKKLGYLKGVPKDAEVGEILENAEVIADI